MNNDNNNVVGADAFSKRNSRLAAKRRNQRQADSYRKVHSLRPDLRPEASVSVLFALLKVEQEDKNRLRALAVAVKVEESLLLGKEPSRD